jgi:hypothetical protein
VASLHHPSFPDGAADIWTPAAGTITSYASGAEGEPRQPWFSVEYEGNIEMFADPYSAVDLCIVNIKWDRKGAAKLCFTGACIGAVLLLILAVAGLSGDGKVLSVMAGIAAAGLLGWGWSQKNKDARYEEAVLEYVRKIAPPLQH